MSGIYSNMFNAQVRSKVPEVGGPATILYFSDRDPATVTEVSKSGKKIVVTLDDYKRIDKLGMSDCQEYEYTQNPNGCQYTYTLRKNGRWVREGVGLNSSLSLIVGHRERYYDFTF